MLLLRVPLLVALTLVFTFGLLPCGFDCFLAEPFQTGCLLLIEVIGVQTRRRGSEALTTLLVFGLERLFGLDTEPLLAFLQLNLMKLFGLDPESCSSFQLLAFGFLDSMQRVYSRDGSVTARSEASLAQL